MSDSTHDGFTTSAGDHCIVPGCTIDAEGGHSIGGLRPATQDPESIDALHRLAETVAPVKRKRRTKAEIAAAAACAPGNSGDHVEVVAEPSDPTEASLKDYVPTEAPVLEVNRSTTFDVVQVIRELMQERPREPMGNIGPSGLGGCERKMGYQLAYGSDGYRDDGSWIARVGTAVHAELDAMFNGRIEATGHKRWFASIKITDPVRGYIDVYDAATRTALDFKVVGAATLGKARKGEIDEKYEVQGDVYAMGLQRMGFPVENVAVLFLPKTQGLDKSVWYSRPVNLDRAQAAVDRLERVRDIVGPAVAAVNAGSTAGDIAMAIESLGRSEDFCRECPVKRARLCDGAPMKIPAEPTGWAAWDRVTGAAA